jgi:ankyrin repeat protein
MQRGLDPNRPNWLGITLLHRCAAKGDIATAEICLAFGADLNVTGNRFVLDAFGRCRSYREKKRWSSGFWRKGADPKTPADEPWAWPIQWAQRRGHRDIATLLQ